MYSIIYFCQAEEAWNYIIIARKAFLLFEKLQDLSTDEISQLEILVYEARTKLHLMDQLSASFLVYQCNPDKENCALKEEFGITNQVERNFLIMGVQAWIRAFTGPHLFVFLP